MAYLNKDEMVIDAVLTDVGRKYLSQGYLPITKFALGDFGVDYRLYNPGNLKGADSYGIAIESMPVPEVIPDSAINMKYKLFTSELRKTVEVPYLRLDTPLEANNITVDTDGNRDITVTIQRFSGGDEGTYTWTLMDTSYVTFDDINPCPALGACTISKRTNTIAIRGQNENINEDKVGVTKLIVTNDMTGATLTIGITVLRKVI
jgi:hypothetical protein